MAERKHTKQAQRSKPRVHVFPPRAKRTSTTFGTMVELKAAVRADLGFGPGWVRPDAWDREELATLPQRRALELLERLRKDVEALKLDVRIASKFSKHTTDEGGAIDVLRKWLDVFELKTLSLSELRGEVARFVRYNDELADAAGEGRLTDRELAEALLRTGWWPDTNRPPTDLSISDIKKLATNAVRKIRADRDTSTP